MMARRRRIRWDRMAVAVIALVIVIFLFGSCVQHCTRDDDEDPSPVSGQTSSSSADAADPAASGSSAGTATGSGTQTSAATTTASASLVNLPQVVTEANQVQSMPIATETGVTTAAADPGTVLPDSYQAVSMPNEAVHKGSLILVDKKHACELSKEDLDLEQVYFASDKPDTYEVSYPGHTALNKAALSKFNRLMKAYYNATSNTEIMFNYGWLKEGQEKSNPESATALDVQLHVKRNDGGYEYVSNVSPYAWIFEHMASYGYVLRYPDDKTDITGYKGGYTAIRYVGVPHAAYMYENNLVLEEYLELLKNSYSFGKGVLEYSTTELSYQIYYFPASKTGTTEVPVPKTGSYEISGNNDDGFIVTVIVG